MQIIDNINKTVKDDLQAGIHKGSKMSVAAACFSIYAYQELKKHAFFFRVRVAVHPFRLVSDGR